MTSTSARAALTTDIAVSLLEPNPRPPVEGRPSNHVAILGVQGFLMGLSMVVVGLRMFVRRTILKTFGWDDWVILISAVSTIRASASPWQDPCSESKLMKGWCP